MKTCVVGDKFFMAMFILWNVDDESKLTFMLNNDKIIVPIYTYPHFDV